MAQYLDKAGVKALWSAIKQQYDPALTAKGTSLEAIEGVSGENVQAALANIYEQVKTVEGKADSWKDKFLNSAEVVKGTYDAETKTYNPDGAGQVLHLVVATGDGSDATDVYADVSALVDTFDGRDIELTGYAKGTSDAAIAPNDKLNQAFSKVEVRLDKVGESITEVEGKIPTSVGLSASANAVSATLGGSGSVSIAAGENMGSVTTADNTITISGKDWSEAIEEAKKAGTDVAVGLSGAMDGGKYKISTSGTGAGTASVSITAGDNITVAATADGVSVAGKDWKSDIDTAIANVAGDYATAAQGATADSALQEVTVNGNKLTKTSNSVTLTGGNVNTASAIGTHAVGTAVDTVLADLDTRVSAVKSSADGKLSGVKLNDNTVEATDGVVNLKIDGASLNVDDSAETKQTIKDAIAAVSTTAAKGVSDAATAQAKADENAASITALQTSLDGYQPKLSEIAANDTYSLVKYNNVGVVTAGKALEASDITALGFQAGTFEEGATADSAIPSAEITLANLNGTW